MIVRLSYSAATLRATAWSIGAWRVFHWVARS
jgi:hypothetical protein